MSDAILATVLGKRIVGWSAPDDHGAGATEVELTLDDGRVITFGAAEQCGDEPVVWYDVRKKAKP